MPCPGAGTQAATGTLAEMREAIPRRRRPAAARTIALYSPLSSLRKRVSRLPRIGLKRAPGNSRVNCAIRRTLLVPSDGDSPSAATTSLKDISAVRTVLDGNTIASRGSSRASTAPTFKPSGRIAGMSLLLWTARSISSRSNASSISLTNSRLPPASESGASCSRSPAVLMTVMRHERPLVSRSRAATASACHSAS